MHACMYVCMSLFLSVGLASWHGWHGFWDEQMIKKRRCERRSGSFISHISIRSCAINTSTLTLRAASHPLTRVQVRKTLRRGGRGSKQSLLLCLFSSREKSPLSSTITGTLGLRRRGTSFARRTLWCCVREPKERMKFLKK